MFVVARRAKPDAPWIILSQTYDSETAAARCAERMVASDINNTYYVFQATAEFTAQLKVEGRSLR